MCDNKEECCSSCSQLEAEAIHSNEQLLEFNVRSKDIDWHDFVAAKKYRTAPVYLQRQFNLISHYREPIGNHNRRKLLVCHDMMGNYKEDRHYHSSKKYDDYRFYHWAAVDYFCYFSHNYITIPPCGWINAAHKHGVSVLGTFIAEDTQGSKLLHEVLQSTEMVDSIVDAMVKLCKHYHFEGWLVNVECKVNPESMEKLYYFVNKLREVIQKNIDSGIVFWYDSVIESGTLLWQNELNAKNVNFFKSANAMLINYTWNDASLEQTRSMCNELQAPTQNVFFGIDVFGRNQLAKFQSKGTLARIVQYRFSTGIFAPGWTFETLQKYGYNIATLEGDDAVNNAFLLRNEKFWWLLWDHLATHPYTSLPFYTDFCLGSGKRSYNCGLPQNITEDVKDEGKFFNLCRQSLQPSVPLHDLATRCYDDAFNGGSCLSIKNGNTSFRLFATEFKFPFAGLVFAYAYKLNPRDGELECILRFCTGNNSRDCYLHMGDYNDTVSQSRGHCYILPFKPKYNDLLSDKLVCAQIPKDMAFDDFEANGWKVRYYVVEFDGFVQVKDIGVHYRQSAEAIDTAYLGAVYLKHFNVNDHDFPADSNIALIMAYGGNLLN